MLRQKLGGRVDYHEGHEEPSAVFGRNHMKQSLARPDTGDNLRYLEYLKHRGTESTEMDADGKTLCPLWLCVLMLFNTH